MKLPKTKLWPGIAILGLIFSIVSSMFAFLQYFPMKIIYAITYLRGSRLTHTFISAISRFFLAVATKQSRPALSSQHPFFNKIWNPSMRKLLRFFCLLLATSLCTYLSSPTGVNAQDRPQITLGYTMINGRIGPLEATEGEIALVSVQSDKNVSSALDVTVNVTQTGNFVGIVPDNVQYPAPFTHGVLGKNTVTIPAGKKVAIFGIAFTDDKIHENNGTVSVSLAREPTYSVILEPLSARQKTFRVQDDEPEPVFSIATMSTIISDTDSFEVSVTSNIGSENQYAINLSISTPFTGLVPSSNQSATINFPALATTQSHTISVADVATSTTDGHPVSVSIDSSDSYNVNLAKRIVQVNVIDGMNLPTVTIAAGSASVSEGAPASFTITSTSASTSPTQINLKITSTGDSLYRIPYDTIELPANDTSVAYVLPTESDGATTGSAGRITVTLEPSKDYKLGSQKSAEVTITNDGSTQMPILYIDNKSETINNENGNNRVSNSVTVTSSGTTNAEFTVFSNVNLGSGFTVSYLAENIDGSFITSSLTGTTQTQFIDFSLVTGGTGIYSGTLEIPVVQDANRKSGEVQVTLIDPTNSTYSVHKVNKSATMRVIKDSSNLPVVSITGGGRFEEGQNGVFYLQADRAPSSAIQVTVALTDPELFLVSRSNRTVEISSTIPVPLYLPTDGDSNLDTDNTVSATIQADPAATDTYEVSSVNNSASITIFDNDNLTLPSVQITGTAPVTEGNTAGFTITVSPAPSQPLEVNIDILREGDFFPDEIESKLTKKTVTIPTTGTYNYLEPTVSDAVDEPHGKITVTVRTSDTNPDSYSVRSQFKASITINDNDHANTPAVSIVAGGDIVEGENAFFTISTNEPIATALPVGISIAYRGEFFSQTGVQTPTITLPISIAGQDETTSSSYIYHIPTLYDMEDEEDGHVIISIQNDSDPTPRYSIGANSIATVVVKDDDDPGPVIGIRSTYVETGVTINSSFTFSILSTTPIQQSTSITVAVETIGQNVPNLADRDFLQNNQRILTINPGEGRKFSTVNVENCVTCRANFTSGRYVLSLIKKANYSIHPTLNKVEINIKNNDPNRATLPVISIVPTDSNSIVEGQTASFTITSDKPLTEDLKINYWISYDRVFTNNNLYGSKSITFEVDRITPTTHVLEIPTPIHDDWLKSATLSIQLREGKKYVRSPYATEINASIVVDDKSVYSRPSSPNLTAKPGSQIKPVVSVTALTSNVQEKEVVSFQISARNAIKSTVKNGRIVNSIENSQPLLVGFRLTGIAIPDYLKRPNSLNFSTIESFNLGVKRFEANINKIAQSFYGCKSFPNFEFSCWVNGKRKFDIRPDDGNGTRKISMKMLGAPRGAQTDYFVDNSKASATITVNDESLPVITVEPLQVSINNNPGAGSYAEFQLKSDDITDNISTRIMLQVDDPRGIVAHISSSTDRLEQTTDNTFQPGRPYELIFDPRNDGRFIVDFYNVANSLSADAFITVRILPSQSTNKYVVGTPSEATQIARAQSTSATGVSIFALSESVRSGEPVFFNIKSKNNFSSETIVSVQLNQGNGNFIAGDQGLIRQLTFEANTKSQYLKVDTRELSPNSKTQSITATLQSGSGYTIVQAHNSAKTSVTPYQQHLIASVKNVTGSNGGTLETENGVIETAKTNIVEGEIAYFEFTLSIPRNNLSLSNGRKITGYQMPKEGIVVDFIVEDTEHNFIFTDSSNNIDYAYSVHFPYREFLPNNVIESGSDTDPIVFTTLILPIQTQVVAGYNFGPLRISIGNDPTGGRLYQAAASPNNSASINIRDNGLSPPQVSIQRGTDPITGQPINTITEGEQLRAVISLSIQAGYQFYVQLKATEIGNFLNVGQDGKNFNVEIGLGTNQRDFIPVIFDDNVEEDNGKVRFTVMAGAGYSINSNQNMVDFDIMDNDGPPTIGFGVTDSIGEGVGNAEIAVTLTHPTEMPVNFKYITMTGTATASEDYTEIVATAPATGTFERGHSTIMIPVAITDDEVDEADENFVVRITEVTNGNFAGSTTFIEQTFTIVDNDEFPIIGISGPVTVNEAAGFAEVEVTISEMSEQIVGFSYITENSSAFARADFTGITAETPATGMISAKASNTTIQIPIRNDNLAEQNEDFVVKITGLTNARFPDNQDSVETRVTIVDNDEVSFSIADASVFEGNTGAKAMEFVVSLSAVATRPVSVTWGTHVFNLQDTATPGEDFIETTNNTLEFAPRETSKSIAVMIMGDTEEESNETFTVGLTNPSTGSNIAINAATGQIVSDDGNASPLIILSAGSSATEGVTAQFTFSANPSVNLPVVVHYNVTIDGNFTLWRIKRTVTLTESSGILRIKTHDDAIDEPDGSITVTLVATQHYQTLDNLDSRTITISDNDLAPDNPNRLEPDPRISVASSAADAIIDFLSAETPESAQLNENVAMLSTVSIQATRIIVNEGNSVEFVLISNSLSETFNISVKLSVNPVGEFFEFGEPIQTSVHLQASTPVPIIYQTIDDSIAEDDGRLEVSIIADPSYNISNHQGSTFVVISDASDRKERQNLLSASAEAFLPDLTGSLGAGHLDIVSNRVALGLSSSSNRILELGGHQSIQGILTAGGEAINQDATALKSFLGDSTFTLPLLSTDEFAVPMTIWGVGDYRNITSEYQYDSLNWSSELFHGHIGIDAVINNELLVGISTSLSESEVDFGNEGTQNIQFDIQTTALNPYLGWTSNNQNSELSVTAGYGLGTVGINQESYDYETLSSESVTFGLVGSQQLYSSNTIFNGPSDLSIKSETWFARQHINGKEGLLRSINTNAQHFRIRTEGTHQFDLANGSSLNPLFSIGIRGDRKNEQSVWGLEFISGTDYSNPIGLTLAGTGNMLVGEDYQIQKLGLDGSFSFDLNSNKRGLLLEFAPTWGHTNTNIQNSLWSRNILDANFESGQYTEGTSLRSEIGYGLEILHGHSVLTPFARYGFSDTQGTDYQVGTRMNVGPNAKLSISGTQNVSLIGELHNEGRLEGSIIW